MREPIHSGKVSEAALFKSIAVSVVGILLCMICLVGTTWAWYSFSVESGANMTEGANFDFTVEVTKTDPSEGTVSPGTNGTYTFEGGTYTVTLEKKGTAEKGFCKVEATKSGEEAEAITTYYIVNFTGADPISFTVTGSGTLELIPMWGTPAEDYNPIPEGGIKLTLDPVAMTPPPESEQQTDEETETLEQQTEQEQQTPANEESETPEEETEKETAEEQTGTPAESDQETSDPQPQE